MDLDGERRLVVRLAQFLATALLLAGAADARPIADPQPSPGSWQHAKCERYTQAWKAARLHVGSKGLSAEFLSRHEAFLASGCIGPSNVCPHSPEDFELANIMVIAAMNAGMASTFAPFSCSKTQ